MADTAGLWLGERLLIGSLQGALVIALVWLMCRVVPRIPAAAQSALWWLAALKLVLVFTPVPALPIAFLPAAVSAESVFGGTADPSTGSGSPRARSRGDGVPYGGAVNTRDPVRAISWPRFLMLVWLAIVLIQAVRLVRAHRVLRGIVNRSAMWHGADIRELAERLGLSRVPQVRLSDEIDTPQVCGLRNPVVLMPAETMATFSADERRMTLCHELMHIRRRDLTLGWVPACAERLFFFHPLARLAAREYIDAREAACDAAAVRALGVPAGDYGRMLVRLGIGHARPAFAAGGSPFSASSLKRRLRMLEREDAPVSRRWWLALVVIAAVVIPMRLVARTPAPPMAQDNDIAFAVSQEQARLAQHLEKVAEQLKRADTAITAQKQAQQPQQKMIEAMAQIEAAQARAAEQAKALEQHPTEHYKRLLEHMAQGYENALHNQLHHSEKQLTERTAILEAMRQRNLAGDQKTLAQHYRQLAEHYERLAVEQRKLAEEIERIQREATPAK